MLYQITEKGGSGKEYTVYAVDFAHDAFLVYDWEAHCFRWVMISDYMLASDKEKAAPAATGTARK